VLKDICELLLHWFFLNLLDDLCLSRAVISQHGEKSSVLYQHIFRVSSLRLIDDTVTFGDDLLDFRVILDLGRAVQVKVHEFIHPFVFKVAYINLHSHSLTRGEEDIFNFAPHSHRQKVKPSTA